MMQEEAQRLQRQIYMTHPFLPVVVRTLGHEERREYACLIEGPGYYLWNVEDWLRYRASRIEWLRRFTEQERLEVNRKRGRKRKQVPA